ncbi:MAG: nucleotide sugar dehydrogenase [Verrucomicrobiales bacterium]|nr:nucleotide sugar dehydrogenase [Verrucomicrobiales bacterium]
MSSIVQGIGKISVFGLGYVGSVTSACLAERGCNVIGCDISEEKVEMINAGTAPIGEPGLDVLILTQLKAGRLRATTDPAIAVAGSDISLVCVGTPSKASGALDLAFVETVAEQIADAVRAKGSKHAVVFRSTMLPGSTRKIATRFFGDLIESGIVEVFFYPEFLRQGSALADFRQPSLAAIGAWAEDDGIDSIECVLDEVADCVPLESAELLKYSCNAFHATKISFANEIGRIGKRLGIESRQVMKMLCDDHRLNISSYYLRPGTPFGGSCLPKDVSALCQLSRDLGVSLPLMDGLLDSNRRHLESLIERVEAKDCKRILLAGIAFKAGTDDLRGSAMLELAARLLSKGYEVRIFDPDVSLGNLMGANQKFADANLPSLETFFVTDIVSALAEGPSILVVSKPCFDPDALDDAIPLEAGHHIIDVNGWDALRNLPASYEGLCW